MSNVVGLPARRNIARFGRAAEAAAEVFTRHGVNSRECHLEYLKQTGEGGELRGMALVWTLARDAAWAVMRETA